MEHLSNYYTVTSNGNSEEVKLNWVPSSTMQRCAPYNFIVRGYGQKGSPIDDVAYLIFMQSPGICDFVCDRILTSTKNDVDQNIKIYLNIFPNPFDDKIYVDFPSGEFKISIYDTNGQIIFDSKGDKGLEIDTHSLRNGLYIIEIRDESNTLYQKRILKG